MERGSVRPADADDWPVVAQLAGRDPAEGAALARFVQETYDPGLAWVALEGGQVVGTVVAGVTRSAPAPAEGRIVFLAVAAAARRRGLGRRLLDRALEDLRLRGLRRATAEVDGTQVEGLALFRRAGFDTEGQSMGLVLPVETGAVRPAGASALGAVLRPLSQNDLSRLGGLLIHLGIERAEAPHDDLPALTPAQLEMWLTRPATVAYALWESDDPATPLGLAWATRRPDDAVLRFVGVHEDARRRGYGRTLLAALLESLGPRPVRVQLRDPGEERAFFQRLGFVAEHVTYHLLIELQPSEDTRAGPHAVDLE